MSLTMRVIVPDASDSVKTLSFVCSILLRSGTRRLEWKPMMVPRRSRQAVVCARTR